MKKHFFIKGWVLILSLAFVTFSCNKQSNDIPPSEGLTLDTQEVIDKLPQAMLNSNDQYAQQCVNDIESALDMSGIMDDLVPPEDAMRSSKKAIAGDTWKWSISDGMMTYTFYWTYEEVNGKRY